MGLDITLHAISRENINDFLIDVLERRTSPEKVAKKITSDTDQQNHIIGLYDQLIDFTSSPQIEPHTNISNNIAYVFAAISGYIHPYWYSRNEFITSPPKQQIKTKKSSFLSRIFGSNQLEVVIDPTESIILDEEYIGQLNIQNSKTLTGNYSAGGFVPYGKLELLKIKIDREGSFTGDNLKSIQQVISYAEQNKTGILEASEIVSPISNECFSNYANFRAPFLNNEGNLSNARVV